MAVPKISRIAVIGGGPLGIACAKYLLAEGSFEVVDVFEQQNSVEGAWNHITSVANETIAIPQLNPYPPLEPPAWRRREDGLQEPYFTTPMYDNLDTNIPKPLMQFSDKPFKDESQLFPSRQDVSKYIWEYAEDVRHVVKLGHQVTRVHLESTAPDVWLVEWKNLWKGERGSARYDAVAVSNGHYCVPFIPDVPGISEWQKAYPDAISHSKHYRSPESYRGDKVLVVGNAASGSDISRQISTASKLPLLVSARSESTIAKSVAKTTALEMHAGIERFVDPTEATRAVQFADGKLEKDIDRVLFATGYLYSLPFLEPPFAQIVGDGSRLHGVYQHVFCVDHPSLAFIGALMKVAPFTVGEAQSAVVARVWSGRLQLPERPEMEQWEKETEKANGKGRRFHVLEHPKETFYQRFMCDWAAQADHCRGKLPKRWEDRERRIRDHMWEMRAAFIEERRKGRSIHFVEDLGYD